MSGPKESYFDTYLAPLLAQVSAMCRQEGINFFFTVMLDQDDERGKVLACTSAHADATLPGQDKILRLLSVYKGEDVE